MENLGLKRHRYTLATICWLYVIFSSLFLVYVTVDTFYTTVLVMSLINLAVACFGLCSLYVKNEILMKIFGITEIVIIILQTLILLGLLISILFKETILDGGLKFLMDNYDVSDKDRQTMDYIQKEFKCCGRHSYSDWSSMQSIRPHSCCATSDECLSYHSEGCVDVLTPIVSYILLIIGFVWVVSIIMNIWAAISAFALERVYRRNRFDGPHRQGLKNSLTNF